jgi:diguanylate cyclase (GGDEF)-like protein
MRSVTDTPAVAGSASELRALATPITTDDGFRNVLLGGAYAALQVLAATTVSISRWDRRDNVVQPLVNVGDGRTGPQIERLGETRPATDFPRWLNLDDRPGGLIEGAADAGDGDEPAQPADGSCLLAVPILIDGRAWGEICATRGPGQPRFGQSDLDLAGVIAAQLATGIAQSQDLARVAQLAYTDTLTGLANRRAIQRRMELALAKHHRDGTVVSLVVCDLNGLKYVNDALGHDVGDRMLVQFAGLLSASSALVPGSIAGRLGGDEFCVLLEGATADAAVKVAVDICRRAESLPHGQGVSCGVASTGDPVGPVDTPARLFRLADAAQYRAKRSGARSPVVAGREPERDGAVLLADAVAPPGTGDRRALRSRGHLLPSTLLTAGLAALDSHPGAAAGARLEIVATVTAHLVDAGSWQILRLAPGAEAFVADAYAVYRLPADGLDTDPLPSGPLAVGDYPLRRRVAGGGDFVVERAVPVTNLEEWALLEASGYTTKLVAGGGLGAEGWLVEICADQRSAALHDLGAVLRALVAVALLGAVSGAG